MTFQHIAIAYFSLSVLLLFCFGTLAWLVKKRLILPLPDFLREQGDCIITIRPLQREPAELDNQQLVLIRKLLADHYNLYNSADMEFLARLLRERKASLPDAQRLRRLYDRVLEFLEETHG